MMKLFLTFWIVLLFRNNWIVLCSGKAGSEGGFTGGLWGFVTSLASSIVPGKGSSDNSPNYAKLFEFECSLQQKYTKMSESMKSINGKSFENWNPIKFPEASAFSALFVRDIGGYLDAWMDLNESKKLKEGSRVLSQHILWIRSVGSKSATSYFIYRPSFVAELESSSILPHLRYHAEAQETARKVIEAVEAFPNDQIIFAGLQSGGVIAMLHAWMVVSAVPIVFRNLKEFKGELHQLKVFLFDTDCVLSETYARNFPIPSWDVLRFYSRMSPTVSADSCRFDSMKAIGLAYVYTPRLSEYWFGESSHVDRVKFVDYYDTATAAFELQEASENIDNGILEIVDDSASISSEISMSFDGSEPRSSRYSNEHHKHLRSGLTLKTSQPPVPAKNIDSLIEKGIVLLSESVKLSDLFFKNSKELYSKHQTGYLRRNVDGCAAAMQKNLINSLLGKEKESPVVEKGIKNVRCSVEKYDVKTKVALIVCTLLSKDSIKSPILRFRTHLQNEMDEILTQKDISVAVNDWEEISMADLSLTTSESNSNSLSQDQDQQDQEPGHGGNGRSRQISNSEDVYFDDRSIIAGFQEKSEQWASCLDELFDKSSQLNFINPTPNGNYNLKESSASAVESSRKHHAGKSFLSIELPFAAATVAVCEYNLLTQPKNFYQLYSVSPAMFFSIFSEAIETHPIPPVCENVLDPPSISRKNSGNAEKIAETLNGFFNSDGSTDINHKNVVVNGLEIQESFTNLPSNNPYEIFKPALCGKLAECLAQKVLEKLYDCNSHLTLWAGRRHCPETCLHRQSGLGSHPLHLCSRVLNCGDGIYLGFRGCKLFGSEKSLLEEFSPYKILSKLSPPAYFSAFHLKNSDGWKHSRFAVYFNEDARNTFISENVPSSSSASSVRSSHSGVLSKKVSRSREEYEDTYSFKHQHGHDDLISGFEFENKQREGGREEEKVDEEEGDEEEEEEEEEEDYVKFTEEKENENDRDDDDNEEFNVNDFKEVTDVIVPAIENQESNNLTESKDDETSNQEAIQEIAIENESLRVTQISDISILLSHHHTPLIEIDGESTVEPTTTASLITSDTSSSDTNQINTGGKKKRNKGRK